LEHPLAPTVPARRQLLEELDRHAPCPFPNPQVGANQGALVIPIRKGLEKVEVERSILIVNHKGIVAAEVGP